MTRVDELIVELNKVGAHKEAAKVACWNALIDIDAFLGDNESAKRHLLELRNFLVSLESDSEVKPDASQATE